MKIKAPALLATTFIAAFGMHAAPVILPVTYQGRLSDGTNPANGQYEIRFGLFPTPTDGSELQAMTNVVGVSNGLFTTTLELDRDLIPDPASGDRWLEIGVRTNGNASAFTVLSARQQLTFSPYAIRASVATLAENLPTASVAGFNIQSATITADKIAGGEVVKSLNTLHDDVTLAAGANTTITPAGNTLTIAGPTDWHLGGNAGTTPGTDFIGTTDNQPLDFRVNGLRALRLQTSALGAPIVIGGSQANTAASDASGGTIAGGYSNVIASAAYESAIGGGAFNSIQSSAHQSLISGGAFNTVESDTGYGTIAGGSSNAVGAEFSFVGGGYLNSAYGTNSTIGGGYGNSVASLADVIGGGWNNHISASGGAGVIAGGIQNHITGFSGSASIGGGYQNFIEGSGFTTTIGGGWFNYATAPYATIGGGSFNTNSANYATIGGGHFNSATGPNSVVGGGTNNTASGASATVAGGSYNHAPGNWSAVAGGAGNTSSGVHSAVGGGWVNTASGIKGTVGGGSFNVASGFHATVPGGADNQAAGSYSLAAGYQAYAANDGTFVWADDTSGTFSSTTNNQFAVRANNGVMIQATNTALDLRGGGAIRVAGAGIGSSTPAFIHRATAANTSGQVTAIDNPLCNGNPNAILIVRKIGIRAALAEPTTPIQLASITPRHNGESSMKISQPSQ